jgi:hypothetical protein
MPTTSAPRSLSARLRAARGRPTDDEVVVIETPPHPSRSERLPQLDGGKQTRCTNSVMAGQQCDRPAVAGGTLCGNHRAMLGTA